MLLLKFYRNNFFRSYAVWHWAEGFQTVLFTWYMTFHANLSATEIGFFQALTLSPFLVFAIVGGAITDKVGARLTYMVSTGLFAAILIVYGIIDYEYGYIAEFFVFYCIFAGIVSAISNPSIDTFILEATPSNPQENSLMAATTHNVGKLLGTFTSLTLPILSSIGGFVFNGVIMAISVFFLSRHKLLTFDRSKSSESTRSLRLGVIPRIISHYKRCPENLDILLSSGMLGLLIVPTIYILAPLVLRERFPEYGDIMAFINISSWIGAVVATAMAQRFSRLITRPGQVALWLWMGFSAVLLMLIFVDQFLLLCLIVMILGVFRVGKPLVYGKYMSNCPENDRGILISVDQTAFWGLATLGTFSLGTMVDSFGLDNTIIFNAVALLCGVGILTLRGNLVRMKTH